MTEGVIIGLTGSLAGAALLPAQAVRRLPAAHLLADEELGQPKGVRGRSWCSPSMNTSTFSL